MRISDWSSDVCSSDLLLFGKFRPCRFQFVLDLLDLGLIGRVLLVDLRANVLAGRGIAGNALKIDDGDHRRGHLLRPGGPGGAQNAEDRQHPQLAASAPHRPARKSDVKGKGVEGRVTQGVRRNIKKKNTSTKLHKNQ